MNTIAITIPEYRLGRSPVGQDWVSVQKWTGSHYEYVSSFRSREEAERFISDCSHQNTNTMKTTKKQNTNTMKTTKKAMDCYEVHAELVETLNKVFALAGEALYLADAYAGGDSETVKELETQFDELASRAARTLNN